MGFINTSYFYEMDERGQEQRFRLFSLDKTDGIKDGENPDDRFEGMELRSSPGAGDACGSVKLGGSADLPEYRTVNVRHTYEKHGVLVSIKSPVPQRRLCSKTLFASICLPNAAAPAARERIEAAARRLLRGSLLVAAIQSPGNAVAALTELIQKELASQDTPALSGFKLGLYTIKDCGPWQNLAQPAAPEEKKA